MRNLFKQENHMGLPAGYGAVNPEVLLVHRPYLARIAQLSHGHQASVSQLHLAIGISVEEFQDARDVRCKVEIEHKITPSHKPEAQTGVACEETQFIKHGFTGNKRSMGDEFAASPLVERSRLSSAAADRYQRCASWRCFNFCRMIRRVFSLLAGPTPRERHPMRSVEANL